MIGARRRRDPNRASFSSTCTSASSNARWSDVSFSPPSDRGLSPSQRPTDQSSRRLMLPIVPDAWAPVSPTLSPRSAVRELCLPRQEPRPPADILNRSYLGSCSPSLAKFSRTTMCQHVSTSTSTTTLPSANFQTGAFLHPTMTHLTVNGLKPHHHSRHTR